jgi:putative redox protein
MLSGRRRMRHERLYAVDCAECETKAGMIDRIESAITLEGDLNDEQRAQMMETAENCPMHRTLKSEVDIWTVEAPAGK